MELTNTLFRYRGTVAAGTPAWDEATTLLLLMLAPSAPHITEELWTRRLAANGRAWTSIHTQPWPDVDLAATAEATREIPVQVNGKLRDKVTVADRRVDRRHRSGRPGARPDPRDPRRPGTGPDRRRGRWQAHQPCHPLTRRPRGPMSVHRPRPAAERRTTAGRIEATPRSVTARQGPPSSAPLRAWHRRPGSDRQRRGSIADRPGPPSADTARHASRSAN